MNNRQAAQPSFTMVDYVQIQRLEQRIEVLEEKVFKTIKRLRGTEAQKFLIAFHLGLIAPIIELPISQNKKDLLISVMLDIDPDNAKKFLQQLARKEQPLLETESNYTFLSSFFGNIRDNEREAKIESILSKIRTRKEKELKKGVTS